MQETPSSARVSGTDTDCESVITCSRSNYRSRHLRARTDTCILGNRSSRVQGTYRLLQGSFEYNVMSAHNICPTGSVLSRRLTRAAQFLYVTSASRRGQQESRHPTCRSHIGDETGGLLRLQVRLVDGAEILHVSVEHARCGMDIRDGDYRSNTIGASGLPGSNEASFRG